MDRKTLTKEEAMALLNVGDRHLREIATKYGVRKSYSAAANGMSAIEYDAEDLARVVELRRKKPPPAVSLAPTPASPPAVISPPPEEEERRRLPPTYTIELTRKQILSVREAALLTGLSANRVRAALNAGELVGRKIGHSWRMIAGDVIAWATALIRE